MFRPSFSSTVKQAWCTQQGKTLLQVGPSPKIREGANLALHGVLLSPLRLRTSFFHLTVFNVVAGVWHIIPCSLFRELFVIHDCLTLEQRLQNELKKSHNTIVLYCHGNSNHRASPHRLTLYKVFQSMNFHVITFDYRGYGDSSSVRPTEKGVVEDALQVYSWLMECLQGNDKATVILWGHSLGTAIAANLVSNLDELCSNRGSACLPLPKALVLEAPFNNLVNEIERHPFSKSSLNLKKHYYLLDDLNNFTKGLGARISHHLVTWVVDHLVLYECLKRSRGENGAPLEFHVFDKGHNDICEAPGLPQVITKFMNTIKSREAVENNNTM
nr:monoacylglycerol lipase ABHD12-like [Vanessa tameamea]